MEKLSILLFVSLLTLSSCEKDEESTTPNQTEDPHCKCGYIIDVDISFGRPTDIRVVNYCSNRVKTFKVQEPMIGNHIGREYCSNQSW